LEYLKCIACGKCAEGVLSIEEVPDAELSETEKWATKEVMA